MNYGLAYGMEAYGLGQRLGIPTGEAAEILDAYFDGFPNVKTFMEETVQEAKERGYTTTIFGRRRQITELASDNFRIRQMGERMAQNAPVQGSAADIFKLAMIDLDRALDDAGSRARMLLTVHDELVLEVPESRARRHRDAGARRDGGRHRAAGAAHRRHRLRPQLGRGEVARPRLPELRADVPAIEDPYWFDAVAEFLGPAYLRNAFTKGTEQEVDFLVDALGARRRGCGCSTSGAGPGRHSLALARRGHRRRRRRPAPSSCGSPARPRPPSGLAATFEELDVRELDRRRRVRRRPSACARAASGCSAGATRPTSSAGSPRTLRPGGRLAVSAFSAAFAVRHLEAGEEYDPATGVLHERGDGPRTRRATSAQFDLWTTCFTARELELLARGAGLGDVDGPRRHAGRVPAPGRRPSTTTSCSSSRAAPDAIVGRRSTFGNRDRGL